MSTTQTIRAPTEAPPPRQRAPAEEQRSVHPAVKEAVVPEVPITLQHLPPADLDKFIPSPGMPRAHTAISKEQPNGTPHAPSNATPLQQHVQFWDRDGDGIIYPLDTYLGFRALGFSWLLSFLAPFVIHGTFSYPTQPGWLPDPFFSIRLNKMHRTKHGSDSEVYDTEGRFVPQKFEEIFSKYDRENKGALSWRDIQELVYCNMNVMDFTGWIAGRLEWWTFWLLAKDEKGLVSKEKTRGMFDGSLWAQIAADVEAKRKSGRMLRQAVIKSD